MPKNAPIEFVILPEAKYERLYMPSFERPPYTKDLTEAMHRSEFKRLDAALRKALSARWEESAFGDKDSAIMDDSEAFGGWHHCGGIYSPRICCPGYVETVLAVLSALPHAALWTYHTACETWQDDSPLPVHGEFFIRGGTFYAPQDENDYAAVFGRKR